MIAAVVLSSLVIPTSAAVARGGIPTFVLTVGRPQTHFLHDFELVLAILIAL